MCLWRQPDCSCVRLGKVPQLNTNFNTWSICFSHPQHCLSSWTNEIWSFFLPFYGHVFFFPFSTFWFACQPELWEPCSDKIHKGWTFHLFTSSYFKRHRSSKCTPSWAQTIGIRRCFTRTEILGVAGLTHHLVCVAHKIKNYRLLTTLNEPLFLRLVIEHYKEFQLKIECRYFLKSMITVYIFFVLSAFFLVALFTEQQVWADAYWTERRRQE